MTPNGLWLLDIKTSASLQEQKELKYQLQLAFYRMMAEQVFKVPVTVGGIVWFPDLANNPKANHQRVRPRDISTIFFDLPNFRRNEVADKNYEPNTLTFFEQEPSFAA